MIGKNHHGVDVKWVLSFGLPDPRSQSIHMLNRPSAAAFSRIDRKEIGFSGCIGATVAHGL